MSQMDYNRREPKSNGRRFITVLVLVVVLCLVSFSLGLMVGKSGKPSVATTRIQTVPVPPAKNVKVGEVEPPVEDVVVQPADATTSAEAQEISQDPLRELLPPVEQMPLGSGINHSSEPIGSQPPESAESVAPVKAAPPAEPVKQPVVKPVTAEAARPSVTTTVGAGYVVQVASFKHRQDAETMSTKLAKDFPVVVREADLGEKGVWYRVLVGPVASKVEAETLKQDLKKKASTDGFIKKISG